ncbi:hypothetical protein CERSUDRAFT_114554 [Gelatoporia subvermispora B]|uniref:Uncharacterized protein n=1 Tax=Ceriporiopsis subvermispora (strain B) TaxID=914234 RepID=M2PNB1_CERS8|nr:hypothetical protein CERSUDRAFT_114554 [Gelatoporia subvermispora B]
MACPPQCTPDWEVQNCSLQARMTQSNCFDKKRPLLTRPVGNEEGLERTPEDTRQVREEVLGSGQTQGRTMSVHLTSCGGSLRNARREQKADSRQRLYAAIRAKKGRLNVSTAPVTLDLNGSTARLHHGMWAAFL